MLCATSQPCRLFVFVVMICGMVLSPLTTGVPDYPLLKIIKEELKHCPSYLQRSTCSYDASHADICRYFRIISLSLNLPEKLDYSATTLEFSTTIM